MPKFRLIKTPRTPATVYPALIQAMTRDRRRQRRYSGGLMNS